MTSDIIGADVSNNDVPMADLTGIIASVRASLNGLGQPATAPEGDHEVTAAGIRKSVTRGYITSFLDGKQ